MAASTLRTRSKASSGPKISSLSTGESAGRSAATVGATNQPSPGSPSARSAAMRPALAREVAVALDALLGVALDDGRDVDAEGVGLADDEHLDGAGDALEQRVGDRLVDEHARGRRALLAGVDERARHDRRHDVVEVGVGVDDHAVLAAHLGHDALEVALAGRARRRRG